MEMATFKKESALNREGYERLREHIRRDCAGKHVALAHGRVVGTASTFDAARALVQRLEPMPEYHLVFPAEVEPDFDLIFDLGSA